ncbi:protein Cep78 homolog [Stomoxys calcitrans]|uniref:protein Cep78 homolog n=1 Tax=Stomoxys calcitrans TaxID=35570 RepID=UPI0027E23D04|nr:protein Cep78 homolog [Stomoxys calcitrans]
MKMYKCNNYELRDVTGVNSTKKLIRCRSFHFRYLELCRAKNLSPLPDIKSKNNCTTILDIFGDKLCVNDWLLVVEALFNDQVLQTLAIRMRKTFPNVLQQLDTEKKAKLFRQKPVLFTKFVFSGVVEAVSNCIEFSKNLRVLNLEGLPLNGIYAETVGKAISSNRGLQDISFQRSNIGDKGCEAICNAIKYLENVKKLNLSECGLTPKGADFVANMIKIQKITRFTDSWQNSLRYRNVDTDKMPGLRSLTLARNHQIGDEGLKTIVEELKENVWIKFIDMENCGLTDRGANMILDCLEMNNDIVDFSVRNNTDMSKFMQRTIREKLGKVDEDQQLMSEQQEDLVPGPNGTMIKVRKQTVAALDEQLKRLQDKLAFERVLRKKADALNAKLNQQLLAYEAQLQKEIQSNIPEGFILVRDESLQSIITERNNFQKLACSVVVSEDELTPAQDMSSSETSSQNCVSNLSTIPESVIGEVPPNSCLSRQRKPHKVRKVKSATKYTEPPSKGPAKKKISKSDQEFSNESDGYMAITGYIESNVGDTLSNNTNWSTNTASTVINTRLQLQNSKYPNVPPHNSEIDGLSMSTPSSVRSDVNDSTDLDTLRHEIDNQPMKLFLRRREQKATLPLTPMPEKKERKQKNREKSPRSLFFGFGDD